MPPDAISRSRTYLPKIWGNTRVHRTALLALSLGPGCREVPGPVREHPIRTHWQPGCTPPDGDGAELGLEALGDFDPSGSTFETFGAADRDVPLVIPPDTRAVVVDGTTGFSTFHGTAEVGRGGEFDVALYPTDDACRLSLTDGSYPDDGPGQAVGVTGDGRYLVVSGGEKTGAGALVTELATGISREDSARTFRAGATATAFGDGLLVAGGYDPKSLSPIGTAELFDSGAGAFESARIALERPRAHHAAVTLAGGETLLVGGEDEQGRLLETLEVIDPRTRDYRIGNLTDLQFPRRDPVALRLSDDRVLVAGGTDADGAPVDRMQWLTADASRTDGVLALSQGGDAATAGRAFVAMPGGSVLVAGGCVLRTPGPAEAAKCEVACGAGGGCASREVLWVTSDGIATALPDALTEGAPAPVLVRGSDGRPFLFARDPSTPAGGGLRVVRRFDPFTGEFTLDTTTPAPSDVASHFVTVDAGLFAYLDESDSGTALFGVRHGTRGAYTASVSPFLGTALDGVALDRAPSGVFDPGSPAAVRLTSAARLVLTDTTYADFHVEISVDSGSAPLVHLGDRTYGTDDCAWPDPGRAPIVVRVDRGDGRVRLTTSEGSTDCAGPEGRVSIQLQGGGAVTRVTSVVVGREPKP